MSEATIRYAQAGYQAASADNLDYQAVSIFTEDETAALCSVTKAQGNQYPQDFVWQEVKGEILKQFSPTYFNIGYANAQALTSTAIQAMAYEQTAGLCGITLDAEKRSPADFFYETVKMQIVNERKADEEDLALYEQLEALKQELGAA